MRPNNKQVNRSNRISDELLDEIKKAIISVELFGSVEIYIQNGIVNQITVRKIKKTNTQNINFVKKNGKYLQ